MKTKLYLAFCECIENEIKENGHLSIDMMNVIWDSHNQNQKWVNYNLDKYPLINLYGLTAYIRKMNFVPVKDISVKNFINRVSGKEYVKIDKDILPYIHDVYVPEKATLLERNG